MPHTVPPRSAAARDPGPRPLSAGHCWPMPLQEETLKGRSGSVSCGGHCSIPSVLVYMRFCLHPLRISNGSEIWFYIWLHPSYCLVGACLLPLDAEYLFLVGSNIFLLMVVQQLVAVLVFSQKKMNTCPTLPWLSGIVISIPWIILRIGATMQKKKGLKLCLKSTKSQ